MSLEDLRAMHPRLIPPTVRSDASALLDDVLARFFAEVEAILPPEGRLGLDAIRVKYDLQIDFDPEEVSREVASELEVRAYVARCRAELVGEERLSRRGGSDRNTAGEAFGWGRFGHCFTGLGYFTYDPAQDDAVALRAEDLEGAGIDLIC